MTNIPDEKLKEVADKVEAILVENKMALQPYMNRNIQGTFAAVRLVSTEEEEVSDNTTENVEGSDTKEADGVGNSIGPAPTK